MGADLHLKTGVNFTRFAAVFHSAVTSAQARQSLAMYPFQNWQRFAGSLVYPSSATALLKENIQ